jgi:hypothetical protein
MREGKTVGPVAVRVVMEPHVESLEGFTRNGLDLARVRAGEVVPVEQEGSEGRIGCEKVDGE